MHGIMNVMQWPINDMNICGFKQRISRMAKRMTLVAFSVRNALYIFNMVEGDDLNWFE